MDNNEWNEWDTLTTSMQEYIGGLADQRTAALARAESAEAELAALQAQVAGQGWRPVDDAPGGTSPMSYITTLRMYLNEPCRICGRLIDEGDLDDLKFAGYSEKFPGARSAHLRCWEGMLDAIQAAPFDIKRDLLKETTP